MKLGVLIPCYDHGSTVGAVVEALAPTGLPCLLVDDGSGPETRETLEALAKRLALRRGAAPRPQPRQGRRAQGRLSAPRPRAAGTA